MRQIVLALGIAAVTVFAANQPVTAQVAGTQTLGVAVAEMKAVTLGWSARKQFLGQPVYNDKDEKIGTIDDVIITPDKAVSYVIIGAGGFAGIGKHDVAIPVTQLTHQGDKVVLPGATKDAVKALPEFKYAKAK
jgi:sporulation protein YlmC with PRC-barrel domain